MPAFSNFMLHFIIYFSVAPSPTKAASKNSPTAKSKSTPLNIVSYWPINFYLFFCSRIKFYNDHNNAGSSATSLTFIEVKKLL